MAIAPLAAPTGIAPATPSVAAAGPTPGRESFRALLEARTPMRAPGPAPAAAGQGAALSVLAGVERAQARLDAVLAAARGGRTFTAAELIGLQAEAYRCAQTVDLASKLVEQGAQSVKHAVNTQL